MASSTCSYAVFRYSKDARAGYSTPVGVALWSEASQFAELRFVSKDERIKGISRSSDLPYIELAAQKVGKWRNEGDLPYQQEELSPYCDDWWRHVRNLLIHRVQVSEPLSIDCNDPGSGIETLFNSVIRLEKKAGQRIDSMLTKALGPQLSAKLGRGHVDGYAGKPVEVMRVFSGSAGDVLIDAVNLAAGDAPEKADEMVGRLRRARLNGHGLEPRERSVSAIVGYVSSPAGLNGEEYLKRWIEEGGDARAFDLRTESQKLHDAADEAIFRASDPLING
jgi:hypothetical protein